MLQLENISKAYGEKELFNDLNVTITDDARIGLIGVNGTGKSTLLKVIAGLEAPDTGMIHYPKDYTIAYLDQNPIFPKDISVLDYLFAGESKVMAVMRAYEKTLRKLEREPQSEKCQAALMNAQQQMDKHEAWDANAKAKTILTKLGISKFDANVQQLSGGEKKRAAIASTAFSL